MRARRAIVVALAGLLAAGCSAGTREAGVQQGPYPVTRAVDGDTIRVMRDGQEIAVRLIGINTPETVALRDLREHGARRSSPAPATPR